MSLFSVLNYKSSTTTGGIPIDNASNNSNDDDGSSVSITLALMMLTLVFLWIAVIGSSRVLKVLDRRHFLIGAAQAKARWNNLYGPGNNINGTEGGIGGAHHQQLSTPLRGSQVAARHTSSAASSQQRYNTSGATLNSNANGVYGSAFIENILCDNRFVFGLFAILLGIGRGAYLISYLFMHGANNGANSGIAGDNVLSDTVTAPLAWFFFALLAAILWTLRDLLDRVNLLLGPSSPAPGVDDLGSGGGDGSEHDGLMTNNNTTINTPSSAIAANTTTPSSSPTRGKGKEQQQRRQGAPPARVQTAGSISNYSMATRKSVDEGGMKGGGDSREALDEENNNNASNNNNDDENNNKNTPQKELPVPEQDSEDELATPVKRKNSNAAVSIDNNEHESQVAGGGFCGCCSKQGDFKKYRALMTITVIFLVILVSLIFSWIERNRDPSSDSIQVVPATLSSLVCFSLMLWGVACSYESVKLLRSIGIVAHRVAIAIITMSIFLLARGILILPPVQSDLCVGSDNDKFWGCLFLYNFVDCAGIALILQILP